MMAEMQKMGLDPKDFNMGGASSYEDPDLAELDAYARKQGKLHNCMTLTCLFYFYSGWRGWSY